MYFYSSHSFDIINDLYILLGPVYIIAAVGASNALGLLQALAPQCLLMIVKYGFIESVTLDA